MDMDIPFNASNLTAAAHQNVTDSLIYKNSTTVVNYTTEIKQHSKCFLDSFQMSPSFHQNIFIICSYGFVAMSYLVAIALILLFKKLRQNVLSVMMIIGEMQLEGFLVMQ